MTTNFYDSEQALTQYLLLHYGKAATVVPYSFGPKDALEFPVRCVTECLDRHRLGPTARALDLGCAVGRASFELARYCQEVVGIDFSQRFIEVASHLRNNGSYNFSYSEEGDLTLQTTASVPPEITRDRVTFIQGDAQRLPTSLGRFDVVLMANLLDRLQEPRLCLQRLGELVKPGGQLILTSPYTWTEEFTPKKNWLGGFARGEKRIYTFDTLLEVLSLQFELPHCRNIPFLIREHARKYQWSVAHASTWVRKGRG